MSTTGSMLKTHPRDLNGIDHEVVTKCIEACVECAQACTSCDDA
ncbi:four-helix bundle copper-binding protein [Mycobacterium sp. HUMS_1102779]